ncbi:holin [Bifidobacterium hapali]|uniref:Holin n=1 Tax=Bifidobacterium hapali TaxID=1630172 RepID=A0A261FTS7_9BIFI|nr:phage holin [Bifidobacterium hapali]OZG62582.1 holin [Bifidobacterium hapali]
MSENTEPKTDIPDWLLPDRVYDILKWVALIVLPALATLMQTLGPVWDWQWADPAATTINAVALTICVIIGASAIKARAAKTE